MLGRETATISKFSALSFETCLSLHFDIKNIAWSSQRLFFISPFSSAPKNENCFCLEVGLNHFIETKTCFFLEIEMVHRISQRDLLKNIQPTTTCAGSFSACTNDGFCWFSYHWCNFDCVS